MTLDAVAASARAQTTAADPALSVFVTANAGSGKTTTLVSRVARLLLGGAAPGAVLCLTYTKAAAAEMQARLFARLGEWAVMDDARLSDELSRLQGADDDALTGLEMSGDDLSRARRLFARALETPGGLKIQTIHAFCEKLLRRFPIEAGVSPRFTVLEDASAAALSHSAREDLARAALADPDGVVGQAYSHFAVALDWERFQALLGLIETRREALAAYVDAVAAGEAPDPYALVDAPRDEDPEAVGRAFMAALDPVAWAAAADGFSTGKVTDQKIAAQMQAAAPPDAAFDALEGLFVDSKGRPRETFGTQSAPPISAAWLAGLRDRWLAARDRIRAARVARDTVHALTLARVHGGFYAEAKARTGALDFTDLVSRTVSLLTEKADAAWVLYKLDGGVDHVLIDEAQDTAPDQWAIVRALTGEFFAGDPGSRTVFAVGDEKQSIYSFQGARPEQLRRQARLYRNLVEGVGGRFIQAPLETSYRSTPEVLAFVDAVFDDPGRRRAVVGPEGDIARHLAARAGQHGGVDIIPLFVDPPKVDRDAFDPVDLEAEAGGRKQLARRLAEDIRRQVATGMAVHDRDGALRPCGYGDFLVLVRRRDALFEEIIRALKLAGVPVAGADRLKLSQHIVFDDLKSLARAALFPDDDLSLAEVLRSPLCDLPDFDGPDSLYALAGAKGRRGLWRELVARAHEQPAWTRARTLVETLIAARDGDPFGFFSTALNRIDDTGRSGRARFLARLGREAEEALDETLNQVLAAEARGATDLETCLALLEAAEVEVKRELEGARGEVRVMTVHGAKGLEAPIVILPDTTMRAKAQGPTLMPAATEAEGDDGAAAAWLMAPGSSKLDCAASAAARAAREARTADETLRLLYVALTRARDRVVVMGRRSATRGAEEGSWWSVIAETFDRLAGEGLARTLDDGTRRYGVDPATASAPAPPLPAATPAPLPGWVADIPAEDAAARFTSPSRLEGRRAPAPSPLAVAAGGLGRFRRGDLIHRLLERLPDLPAADRPSAALRLLARERDLDAATRDEMIAAALGVLDDARFAPVFGPGSRAEVALVGGADALPPGVSISGRIDRLVVAPDRVLVIDYKTNRPAPDRIEDADPAYVRQLAAYVAVLRRLYPDRPVEAALVWTDGPRLMAVPQALMDAALRTTR